MAHRDGHPHVHVIVNRVDAESGKAAGFSRSKLRLSQWAEGYERGQGWIRCSRRVANNLRRRRGERVRDRVSVSTGRHRREKIAWAPPPRGWVILQGRPRVACAMSRLLGKALDIAPEAMRCEIVVRCPLSREGFMHRARLLAPVLLFVAGCGDGGSQTPTSPPAPPTNRAPTVSGAIPDQVLVENTETPVDISGAFSDPDGDALRYGATSDASSVATASVSGSDLKVIGEAPGSATITVTATDPGGLSATQTFEVTVNSANRAPTVSGAIPDQVLVENTEAPVDISGAFSDPDGDALRYGAASDASSVATASVSGSDLKVIGEAPGSATITVMATDPGGLSATQTFEVTVNSANRAPTVSGAIPDQVLVENTETPVDISGAFSDPDGDALRYGAASDASSVATASVSGSDLKVIGEAPGSATITVTATDPGGLSATQTFEVTVNSANRAPTVSGAIPDQVLVENTETPVDISGAFSDPDGDALRYGATSDASSVATASVSGSDLKVIGEAPGSATITVTATDPGGLSATQTFEVTVNSANRAPTVSGAIPDQVLVENTEAPVDISGAFSIPMGTPSDTGPPRTPQALPRRASPISR